MVKKDYIFVNIGKTNTGYGTVGSNKLRVIRTKDNYNMGTFDSIKEFRDDRKSIKSMYKRMAKKWKKLYIKNEKSIIKKRIKWL